MAAELASGSFAAAHVTSMPANPVYTQAGPKLLLVLAGRRLVRFWDTGEQCAQIQDGSHAATTTCDLSL
jgi:hypothetical protein